ncbi:MAG: nucleoside phosphorylase [Flavobacteriaceae bacterium]|nr:nucleoside phosphorylase [Flavobacteriaceae bacterium]
MKLSESELILNPDGSIYHLHLKPGQVATTILTVGDPGRVSEITRHFDRIENSVQKREFKSETGYYKGKHLTVISTGIGTDNIDIVINELDALFNIDFSTRTIRKEFTQLEFIRVGTSGAVQEDIPVDSLVVSEKAIGLDNLFQFYEQVERSDKALAEAFMKHTEWDQRWSRPYAVHADKELLKRFESDRFQRGITVTSVGFYGPQGRALRLRLKDDRLNEKIASFEHEGSRIANFEMETSAIYKMAHLLGHRAISLNTILANRATKAFSRDTAASVEHLITSTLNLLVQ